MSITRAQAEEVIQNARVNLDRLASCPGPHAFVLIKEDWLKSQYKCEKCGGTAYKREVGWYTLGLEHGRKRHKTKPSL